MSCTNPILVYSLGKNPSTGKAMLKFVRKPDFNYKELAHTYGKDNVYFLPCGRCPSCKKNHSNVWAVRLSLEASLYESNYFVTLTYEDHHLPSYGVSKKDVQKFIKNVRNRFGAGIKYFVASEYGSNTLRPHYHAILFNLKLDDLEYLFTSEKGFNQYRSKELSKLWSHGFVSVGYVSFETCSYVAKYSLKQVDNSFYDIVPEGKLKPFRLMSLRPAIGKRWFDEHCDEVAKYDLILFEGQKFHTFTYFMKLLQFVDPIKFEDLKTQRLCTQNLSVASDMLRLGLPNREELYKYNNEIALKYFERRKNKGGV